MAKTNLTPKQELEIVNDYTINKLGIYPICEKYHIGKIKLKSILSKYEINLNNKGKQPLDINFKIDDFKIKKYINTETIYHIVYDENTNFESKDIENTGGTLTTYINKQYGIEIPTLYDRRKYYMTTGDYWWEQWLKVKQIKRPSVKKCPYCDWVTTDVKNNSGMFETHLLKKHNISKIDYLQSHPEEKSYFALAAPTLSMRLFETDKNKFITCQICGEKFVRMTNKHLQKHNITREEYIKKYGLNSLVCKHFSEQMSECARKANENMSFHRVSSKEQEIIDFIKSMGLNVIQDRHILKGLELDMLISEKNVAIEYNGLYWHNELYKNEKYHLNKTKICNNQSIRLIHIFEDEWMFKQDIVKSRLKNVLGITENKIFARKCIIQDVSSIESKLFLEKNHIQGNVNSKYRYGLYYNNELVSLMTFGSLRKNLNGKNKEGHFELLRFCNKLGTIVVGGASKLFKHFIKDINPEEIISYADRRWSDGNLYKQLGFIHDHDSDPNYFYVINNKRENRFKYRKSELVKYYGCPENITEREFCFNKKWYRIWDCGTMVFKWYDTYKEME